MRSIFSLFVAGSIVAVAAIAIGPQPVAGTGHLLRPDCGQAAGSASVPLGDRVAVGAGAPGAGSAHLRDSARGPESRSVGSSARRDALPSAGTASLVKDIYPGADHSWDRAPANLIAVGHRVFFTADDGRHGRELWVTDGSKSGTRLVKDILPGSESSGVGRMTAVGDRLYFTANDGRHGQEPWVSDGSTAGTRLVKDIYPGPHGSRHAGRPMVALGGRLYFAARDPQHGLELWRSDGTRDGTRLVKDIVRGTASSRPSALSAYAGGIAFGTEGKLWWTDGTDGGTRLIAGSKYLRGEYDRAGTPSGLVPVGGLLFFQNEVGMSGGCVDVSEVDLWRTDGTKTGTFKLRPDPMQMVAFGNHLAFFGPGDGGEIRLWLSDGTPDGTQPLRPAQRPGDGMPLSALNGRLYWTARHGSFAATDGTAAGTVVLKDRTETSWNMSEASPAAVRDIVYFVAGYEAADGEDSSFQLWATDGTPTGTGLTATVNPDGDAYPSSLTAVEDKLFMVCTDPEHGRELWVYVP